MKINTNMLYGIIFGFLLGVILIYYLIEIKNNCYIKSDSKNIIDKIIQKLVRQSARWSTAAKQDKNSLVAVLHANYGAGYLWALKDIATNEQIKSATGIDVLMFEHEITKVQDKVTMKLAKLCPKYAPKPSVLTKIGGEG